VTVAGSYSGTAPLTSSGYWIMQMVAFKASDAIDACDVEAYGVVDVKDVQAAIDMDLGVLPCTPQADTATSYSCKTC